MNVPSPKPTLWSRIVMPFRLLYYLIMQPSQATGAPLRQVAPVLLLSSLPFVAGVAQTGAAIGWLLLLSAWCIAAGLVLAGLAKEGSALLLVAGVVALARPPRLVAGINTTFSIPTGGQLLGVLLVSGVLLGVTIGIGALMGRLPWRWPAYSWATFAGIIVALLALVISGQDNSITALALMLFAVALLPLVFGAVDGVLFCFALLGFIFAVFGAITVESRVLVPFSGLVGFIFAYLLRPVLQVFFEQSVGAAPREATLGVVRRASAPLIAVLLIVVAVLGGLLVAGVSVLPAPLFLLVCWFGGFVGLGQYETNWQNMLLLLLVPAIGVETQGVAITALGLLAVLVGSYRLLPEYALFAIISIRGSRAPAEQADHWLRRLPPWPSEHSWLPLPGHTALLHTALEADLPVAFNTVQHMHNHGQPGFERTLLAALPTFIRKQFLKVQTPQDIAALTNAQTSLLISALLQAGRHQGMGHNVNEPATRIRLRPAVELPWERRKQRISPLAIDITLVMPSLRSIAQTVAVALAPPVDPRTLAISHAWFDLGFPSNEKIIEQYLTSASLQPTLSDALAMLDHLAADLAIHSNATARWQQIITHWREALQSAINKCSV